MSFYADKDNHETFHVYTPSIPIADYSYETPYMTLGKSYSFCAKKIEGSNVNYPGISVYELEVQTIKLRK